MLPILRGSPAPRSRIWKLAPVERRLTARWGARRAANHSRPDSPRSSAPLSSPAARAPGGARRGELRRVEPGLARAERYLRGRAGQVRREQLGVLGVEHRLLEA